MPTYWLSFHLPYRCRHALACCSSGWPIPIERDRASAVEREVAAGRVHPLKTHWLLRNTDAPGEMAGTLAVGAGGRCVFLNSDSRAPNARSPKLNTVGSCSIYPSRPMSCVHFPYVCLIDQRGVHVTLSHYCPTAASLLFDHEGPIEIVEGPPPIPNMKIPEGLDARESLPPLASPDRLMSFEDFSEWERERVQGLKGSRVQGVKGSATELFDQARAAIPAPLSWPAAPEHIEHAWSELVEPRWASFASVVDRYLAAKLFASWAAYLGDGTRAVLQEVEIASAVLQVEVARQCLQAARRLDASLLKAAIRQSDLLLLHYTDLAELSRARPI